MDPSKAKLCYSIMSKYIKLLLLNNFHQMTHINTNILYFLNINVKTSFRSKMGET